MGNDSSDITELINRSERIRESESHAAKVLAFLYQEYLEAQTKDDIPFTGHTYPPSIKRMMKVMDFLHQQRIGVDNDLRRATRE